MENVIGIVLLCMFGVLALVILAGLVRRVLQKTIQSDAVVTEKHETVFRMAAVSADGRKHLYVVTFRTADGEHRLTVSQPVYALVNVGDSCQILYKGSVLKGIQGEFASSEENKRKTESEKDRVAGTDGAGCTAEPTDGDSDEDAGKDA